MLSRRNQSFIIVEDAQLPPRRGWDGICGLAWEGISQLEPLYRRLQDMGRKVGLIMSKLTWFEFFLHDIKYVSYHYVYT